MAHLIGEENQDVDPVDTGRKEPHLEILDVDFL